MRWIDRLASSLGRLWPTGLGKQASFAGGRTSRLLLDWVVGILSPDREVQYNLRALRARARDLVRNNPYATGFVEELADNVIGPEGIQIQAKITNARGELQEKTNFAIEDAWEEWDFPEHASADGQDAWVDLQRLVVKTIAMDGECFLRELKGYENDFGYALQILDADLLDETFDRPPGEDGVEIRMGIECNRYGKPLAYHFWRRHPSERGFSRGDRTRIAAEEIIHLFVRYRANQKRGISWFAPVLTTVKHMDGLTEAELVASRMSAAKMGFIINKTPEAISAYAAKLQRFMASGKEPPKQEMEAAPGVIDELSPGQEFQGFDPTHPNTAFEGFLKAILRGIARGLGTTYARLTGDLSDTNYSSMRAGELPVRDRYRAIQTWLAKKLHRRVYRSWVGMALLNPLLLRDLPSRVGSDYYAVAWKPRGWKSVDPLKEVQALEAEVMLGVKSRQEAAAERGSDFEDTIDELAHEQSYAARAGVYIGGGGGIERIAASRQEDQDEDEGADTRRAKRLALAE